MTQSRKFDRRFVLLGVSALSLTACETLDPALIESVLGSGALTEGDAALGIRAALDNGVGNALSNLGRRDGYFGNPTVKIPLPGVLQDLQGYLAPIGADGLLVELQQQLNRGAEKAAPIARDIFIDAVRGLTIQDAINIVRGPDTAATDYLRDRTTTSLINLFSPIMESALADTGALRLVDDIDRQVPVGLLTGSGVDLKSDLIGHGVDYGLRGVFHFIAEEEKAIRKDPAARTSAILRRVFG
ncbi:hypothetical protein GCM10007853_25240 [Algimonas ampicilliniresistens]|uniref:DUF4197 domain-containing protein n=1 Tax=Algimonas ampicilliniresistens TaxID=1298735 RepID=A0ABQ5VD68_9PROT|nr:DUF4197 domain-containing protein [Algimonas ampicilliniresistens]GLQ24650.1 hypothetical protein GCM10007853_25240 [Algimonas ampicilliniresistens]